MMWSSRLADMMIRSLANDTGVMPSPTVWKSATPWVVRSSSYCQWVKSGALIRVSYGRRSCRVIHCLSGGGAQPSTVSRRSKGKHPGGWGCSVTLQSDGCRPSRQIEVVIKWSLPRWIGPSHWLGRKPLVLR